MIRHSGHPHIRHSLYMPAMVALKDNPLIKAFGLRLKGEGLAPKAVIGASMHELVRYIYGVLKTRVMFTAQFPGNSLAFKSVSDRDAARAVQGKARQGKARQGKGF